MTSRRPITDPWGKRAGDAVSGTAVGDRKSTTNGGRGPFGLPGRPAWLNDADFPFESRFVEVGGAVVHYVDEGDGPVLLALHGNPTWSFLYRDIIGRLRDRFRVIALDYPGFGFSRAPEGYDFTPESHTLIVAAFVKRLNLTGITLIAQDWGGPIGLTVATRDPERFEGLVIGNTWAWPLDGERHFERFSRVMGGRLGGFAIRRFNAFVNGLIPLGTRRSVSRRVMRAYRGPFPTAASRRPVHVFPSCLLGSRDFLAKLEADLPKIADRPALIVWGEKDFAFREKERERFERIFPDHETHTLPDAGHYIQEDAPGEIADAIRTWHTQNFSRRPGRA
ncbi:alpha/beta fold hydrolase [bacterium]|nr:alpha/beta fold hydrolase [bacterium]